MHYMILKTIVKMQLTTQQQIAKFCFFTACGEESSNNGFNNLVPRATAQFITTYKITSI